MRVVVAGQGWMAVRGARLVAAALRLLDVDGSVEVVRNRTDDGHDGWLPSLAGLAAAHGWPVHERAERAGLGRNDVLISLQHDRVIDCAGLAGAAAYNLHFADLPRYRGSLSAALPIRHGEVTVGVTLHQLVQQVDAGPVIAARRFPLPEFLSAYELYRTYHGYGFELFKDSLPDLLRGTVTTVDQDEAKATTFLRSAIDFADLCVDDFDRDAAVVRDWVRSLIFPPAQYPVYGNRSVLGCFALEWTPTVPTGHGPGDVVYRDADQVVVTCRAGAVCLEFR